MNTQRLHDRSAFASVSGPFVLSGTGRQYERSRPFLLQHLALDLKLDFEAKSVKGTARWDFRRVDAETTNLILDAVGFEIFKVELDTKGRKSAAKYVYDGDQLSIKIPRKIDAASVVISYRAVPSAGLYFLEPDETVPDRPIQLWSQCQDEDARHWFPCHDKPHMKMTTELRVQVPAGFVVLSNGEPLREPSVVEPQTKSKRAESRRTHHFKLDRPHPSYLITLIVGRFAMIEDRPARLGGGREVPVRYYVPEGRTEDAKRTFAETPRMIELISKLTGVDYPWSRYSQAVVSDFVFGGMENTTVTTMYEHILVDERAAVDIPSEDLVVHELAHQWFGNFVTCRDWSEAWLNEGFATFFEHIDVEHRLGRDEYDWNVARDLDIYLTEATDEYQRPIVAKDWAFPMDLFDRHLYEKGGLVVHMLRRKLGDLCFWNGVNRYLRAHAYGIVETRDLQRALEETSGQSLDRFFDQWVFRPGHPQLTVKVEYSEPNLEIRVQQRQKVADVALFHFDFEVLVGNADGSSTLHSKLIASAEDVLTIRLPKRPHWVAIDPDFKLTAPTTLDVPADMLHAQLEHAPRARHRCLAADALAKRHDTPTIQALGKSLENETAAWMVRARAAAALGQIRGSKAFSILSRFVAVENPKLRRAVVTALGQFRIPEAAELLKAPATGDRSYLVEAAALKALGATRQPSAWKVLELGTHRESWAEVVRSGAMDGLSELGATQAFERVKELTRYGVPSRARRTAIVSMAKLRQDRKTRQYLESLLDDPMLHVRLAVIDALMEIGDPRALRSMASQLKRETDARVTRCLRIALRDLPTTQKSSTKRLSDELASLRGELDELRLRVGRFDQTGGSTPSKISGALRPRAAISERRAGNKHHAAPATPPSPARGAESILPQGAGATRRSHAPASATLQPAIAALPRPVEDSVSENPPSRTVPDRRAPLAPPATASRAPAASPAQAKRKPAAASAKTPTRQRTS